MTDLIGGTIRPGEYVAELGGKRYHVLTERDAAGVPGARTWEYQRVPAQGIEEQDEHEMRLASWHEGAGFSYAGMPNVYERANGWDASAPGKLTTWARHATGQSFTSVNYKGWCIFHAGRLYVARGRFVYWYGISATAGSTWTRTLSKDFGAGMVVAGQPAVFKGNLYVPIADASTGADQRFWQLATIGSPDVWVEGPVGRPARTFTRWHNQRTGAALLVRGTGASVFTVSENPMEAADWGGEIPVDDPGVNITQFLNWRDMLLVAKVNGFFSVDEIEVATNELPDIVSPDNFNGVGGAYSNAQVLVPNKAGLISWMPNSYVFVGPQQEGGLEGDISPGWGRVLEVVPFGKWAYLMVADTLNDAGSIYALEPPRGQRGPLVPHVFHHVDDGFFEAGCVVHDANDIKSYLVALKTNAAGTEAEPWVYQLPRNDYNPGADPTIVKQRDDAQFFTPRYWQPGREIQKSWRVVEFWLEPQPTANTPGLEVWARVDEGTAFQLLDGAGDPAVFRTRGFKQAFFPKDSHGSYVQLEFRIPEKGDGEVDMGATIRDVVLRLDSDPLMTSMIRASIVCGTGEYGDKTSSRRTPVQQLNDLIALDDPQATATPIKDPWGNEFFGKVMVRSVREVVFKNKTTSHWLVDVEIRRRDYG